MAVDFEWEPIWLDGSRDCWFWHEVDQVSDHVRMHACDVIAKSWGADQKSPQYLFRRNLWAQAEAAKIIARRNYEASKEGRLAQAETEKAGLEAAVVAKGVEIADLKAQIAQVEP